jgi:DNA-binding IclR family transcriptional regulator
MVETGQAVRVVPYLGQRLPAHATALGKAQLAFRPPDELEQLWKQHELAGVTSRTITDAGRLGEELARVAAQEVALEDEELAPGVRGAAAPVRDYQKRVVGAVGVVGPASRITLERLSGELVSRVKAAAHAVSKRLGYAVVAG